MPAPKTSRVVDLAAVCLICLREEAGYCSIYGQDLETPHMQIVDKIRNCSSWHLESRLIKLNRLPDKICHGCRNELSITYRFQQKCLEAQRLFEAAAAPPEIEMIMEELEEERLKMIAVPAPEIELIMEEIEEERLKMHLEEQQKVKVPASLKIKRVGIEVEAELESTLLVVPKVEEFQEGDDFLDNDEVDDDDDDDDQQETEQEQLVLSLDEVPLKETNWDADSLSASAPSLNLATETPEEEDDGVEEDGEYVPPTVIPIKATSNRQQSRPRSRSRSNAQTQQQQSQSHSHTASKICEICGNTYKYQHALNAHMRRHRNERPFACEVCQKAFISNVELRRHMRVHTGQKPYGCRFCDRRFSDFGSSKKHERIHTGERPYVCEVCNKGFAYAHVLSVHRRTHTGKSNFSASNATKDSPRNLIWPHIWSNIIPRNSNKNSSSNSSSSLYRIPNQLPKIYLN